MKFLFALGAALVIVSILTVVVLGYLSKKTHHEESSWDDSSPSSNERLAQKTIRPDAQEIMAAMTDIARDEDYRKGVYGTLNDILTPAGQEPYSVKVLSIVMFMGLAILTVFFTGVIYQIL